MRQFVVLVESKAGRPMGYTSAEGEDALCNMETLNGRGHRVTALTAGNGIQEELTIEQMREIYGDEPKAVAARQRAEDMAKRRRGQLELGL